MVWLQHSRSLSWYVGSSRICTSRRTPLILPPVGDYARMPLLDLSDRPQMGRRSVLPTNHPKALAKIDHLLRHDILLPLHLVRHLGRNLPMWSTESCQLVFRKMLTGGLCPRAYQLHRGHSQRCHGLGIGCCRHHRHAGRSTHSQEEGVRHLSHLSRMRREYHVHCSSGLHQVLAHLAHTTGIHRGPTTHCDVSGRAHAHSHLHVMYRLQTAFPTLQGGFERCEFPNQYSIEKVPTVWQQYYETGFDGEHAGHDELATRSVGERS